MSLELWITWTLSWYKQLVEVSVKDQSCCNNQYIAKKPFLLAQCTGTCILVSHFERVVTTCTCIHVQSRTFPHAHCRTNLTMSKFTVYMYMYQLCNLKQIQPQMHTGKEMYLYTIHSCLVFIGKEGWCCQWGMPVARTATEYKIHVIVTGLIGARALNYASSVTTTTCTCMGVY